MKILLIASECPPVAGGIATYVGNTVTMYAAAGHEIVVIARSQKNEREQQENVTFIKVVPKDIHLVSSNTAALSEEHPSFPYNAMGYWGALSYQLAEETINYIRSHGKPDIIESEDYSGLAYFLIQKKLLGCPELEGVPIVLTLHSSQYMLYPASKMPSYGLYDYWVGRMEKFCTLAADGIAAPTQFIANQVINTLGSDLEFDIIPLPAPKRLLDNSGVPASNPTPGDIVYFGRLEVRKGFMELVQACSKLWDKGIDFKLTAIGGDTWYHLQGKHATAYIKEKYQKYFNSGQLVLRSPLRSEELYKRIAQAWCVVIPSLWENFPNTCLESMLLGKVVLASAGMGHVEMLKTEDTQAGFIFDWQERDDFSIQLQKILNLSAEENIALGKQARELILKISGHQNVLEKRISHFHKIIEKSKNRQKDFFPSVNYPPHGKVNPPTYTTVDEKARGIITVCVPFYNAGQYIRETLDSIYASDYPNLEVFILNDGSTDEDSLKVLSSVQHEYKGLKVIHTENRGVAAARNKMAEIASSEYIAFLDSDDKVSPNFYSQSAKILDRYKNVGFVASWIEEFENSQKVWVAWNTEFPYMLCHNMLGVCTVVRRDAYLAAGGMKSVIAENLEDYECWLSICEQGWLGVVIPELHYFYRIRANSRLQTSNRDQLLVLYEQIAALHPELYQKYGTEIYNLTNQNGASWLWENPSKNVYHGTSDTMTGMDILSLVSNKLKRVYRDGGMSLILNRFGRVSRSIFFSKSSK